MTCRERRLAGLAGLVVSAFGPLRAQMPGRLDAGAAAGGSVLGWLPRVGIGGGMDAGSLGPLSLSWQGSVDRVSAPTLSLFETNVGARLAAGGPASGWWAGTQMIRRSGFSDVVEQPRIETGGWRRIGAVVVTVSAARRNARFSGINRFTQTSQHYVVYRDSITGFLDSSLVTTTFGDSTRFSQQSRWAETELGLAWDYHRLSTSMIVGARLASGGVPAGRWASASLGVRLAPPLSLVVGAGSATGGRFALDAEHRFLSFGLRVTPWHTTSRARRAVGRSATVSGFAAIAVGAGRYRLAVEAPRARSVEISGDFTNWKPVRLASDDAGRWTLTLPLTAGTHRVNMRVDNGRWIVPPGLTTMSDDFAGEVGVLVIEDDAR